MLKLAIQLSVQRITLEFFDLFDDKMVLLLGRRSSRPSCGQGDSPRKHTKAPAKRASEFRVPPRKEGSYEDMFS
jgi:hypothetical protein